MIIDVLLEGEEEPRRYRVMRDSGDVCLRRLDAAGGDHDGEIHGWLLQLDGGRRDEALSLLDQVEGSVVGLYVRVRVVTADGDAAWAYQFEGETRGMVDLEGRWPAA